MSVKETGGSRLTPASISRADSQFGGDHAHDAWISHYKSAESSEFARTSNVNFDLEVVIDLNFE